MIDLLSPLNSDSLVSVFVTRFEALILSGQISVGEKLPSERELAVRLGVSRPVVHEGIIELQSKGLVTLRPRKGAYVNDFRREGSLAILESLLSYHNGMLEPRLLDSLLDMRRLFELETARLAAINRTGEVLAQLEDIVRRESSCAASDIETVIDLDFNLHLLVAIASRNLVYPLIINSFKAVYTNLTGKFFMNTSIVPEVFAFHRDLVDAIGSRDADRSVKIMEQILGHGVRFLKGVIEEMKAKDGENRRAV
jgi:DNA-binding FadR family transcriptional regulator